MTVVKKYGNRRLYDTAESRYITLEELAAKIREGTDVQVLDAKTGEDLTQATLTQIIIDSRGAAKLLPAALLTQLIRMQDDALAEFFRKYVSVALEMYFATKRGAQAVSPYVPLSNLPFTAADAFMRMMAGHPLWSGTPSPAPPPAEPVSSPAEPSAAQRDDIAELRAELAELKRSMGKQGK